MEKRKTCVYGAAIMIVAAATAVWIWSKHEWNTYVAGGTFYYWFHGFEMSAGWSEWGGTDPLACFKENLWDRRPRDFFWSVWRESPRRDERNSSQTKSLFKEAYDSVVISRTKPAVTWGKLYVTSRDPVVAADVANAYLKALAKLELRLLEDRKDSSVKSLALVYYRLLMRCRDLENQLSRNRDQQVKETIRDKLETIKKSMVECEADIEIQKNVDVRTNTMFKIMHKAEVPTERMGFWFMMRKKELHEWFDHLTDVPFL